MSDVITLIVFLLVFGIVSGASGGAVISWTLWRLYKKYEPMFQEISQGDVVTIENRDYEVTKEEKGVNTTSGTAKIIQLKEWKEKRLVG